MNESAPRVSALFLAAHDGGPDRIFLCPAGDAPGHSYRAVAAVLVGIVARLRELGVAPGDRALVYADAILPSVRYLLACACAGVVCAPLAPTASPEAAVRLARRIGAKVAFTTAGHRERLGDPGIPVLHDGTGDGALDLWPTPRADDAARLRAGDAGRSADEPYLILSTSGTTGAPRLPVRSHRAFTLPVRHYQAALGLSADPRERLLLCSSLCHGLGQMMLMLGLHLGAELCLPTALEAAIDLGEVRQLDPTLIGVHPRVLLSLARQHRARGRDLDARLLGPSLRRLRIGGGPIDPDWLRRLAAQGIDVGEWYGASETGMVALTPYGQWRPGAIGPPCPGVDVRLADDGEILVRSPTRMSGYYDDEALTRATVDAEGFVQTGDLGQWTPDGMLRIVGRKKDVLNRPDGSNIAAGPLEERWLALPWVEQAVVLGDGRPFLIALLVVRDAPASAEPDGYLDEAVYPGGHARARADLAALNARLEAVERIEACALFARRFDPALYAEVGQGKIRRDRPGLERAYRARIEALYDPPPAPTRAALQALIDGAWVTQALYVAAALGIADRLEGAEARPVAALGTEVGADADSLYRLLRALATLGVFRETPGRGFALTPLAALLRRDHPHSLRHVALLRGMPETYAAWGSLLDTVRSGRPGFDQVFGRARFDHFQAHPEAAAVFQAAMDDKTRALAGAVAAYPGFAGRRRLVDVGGGHGRLLGAILQAWPDLRGVLFDQPAVVAGAGPVLDALSVSERVECVGGDFLAAVPPADAYLLCNILHDWDDATAARLLRVIARAMTADARVLIVEMRLPDASDAPTPAIWLDLHMLVALGGRERTLAEFTALVAAAGLRLERSTPTATPYVILDCAADGASRGCATVGCR